MAFNTAEGRAEYTASGGQVLFTFTFKIYTTADILVYLTPAGQTYDDTTDLLTLTTDYTVVINGDNGGDLTLVVAASAGDMITIVRDLAIDRTTDYQTSGDLAADTLDADQDYQTYLVGDRKLQIDRCLQLPKSVQGTSTTLPPPTPLNVMRWDATGAALENSPIAADSVFVNILNVDAMSDLIGVTNTDSETINVRGYYTINDGGGGIFNWDATANKNTANAGTIIDPSVSLALQGTGAGFGCWVRQYYGYINVKWFGATGNGVADDSSAIQLALNNADNHVFFPQGIYVVNSALTLPTRINFTGVGSHVGSIIKGTHAGNIFEYADLDFAVFEKMAFMGAGCNAFYQTTTTATYTQNITWRDCHFYGDLTECIYGNLIFCKIIDNTFGYYGTVGASHRHIASLGSATNLTNVNLITRNRFYNAVGSESTLFDSGQNIIIYDNNYEANSCLPIRLNGILGPEVESNWFEANTGTVAEIEINAGTHVIDSTPTTVTGNTFIPSAGITQAVTINNPLTKLYFDRNDGIMTGRVVSNDMTKVYSLLGNSFTGLALSDYIWQDSGAFTITDGSGAALVMAGGAGTYKRNGNAVSFSFPITYPATADASPARLTGLPFTSFADIQVIGGVDNTGLDLKYTVDASSLTITPYISATAFTRPTNAQMSGAQLYISGTYIIA